ncbi:hypothetical protein QAD02_011833 [Eretmocerus hayati]|uniref:Uncharacterized protein n=1 Tax=Eretmocerus hayati TaxID=131215 RepID=A0ACC2P0S2_9HYME|nr:hypothetical protein QAD02_011833 [Eretmocerus hayati]
MLPLNRAYCVVGAVLSALDVVDAAGEDKIQEATALARDCDSWVRFRASVIVGLVHRRREAVQFLSDETGVVLELGPQNIATLATGSNFWVRSGDGGPRRDNTVRQLMFDACRERHASIPDLLDATP